jgi:hypothetical protein
MSEDEQLPDNLSLLVEDILSHRFKRNLSIEQPPKEIVTSTPVMKGPRTKKLITPSKVFNYPKPKLQIDDLVERSHESKENLIPKKKLVKPKIGGASAATFGSGKNGNSGSREKTRENKVGGASVANYGASSRCSSGSDKNGNAGTREKTRENKVGGASVANYGASSRCSSGSDKNGNAGTREKTRENKAVRQNKLDSNKVDSHYSIQKPILTDQDSDFKDSFDSLVKNLEFEADELPVFKDNNSVKPISNCLDPKKELVAEIEDDFEDSFDRMCNVKSGFGSKRM